MPTLQDRIDQWQKMTAEAPDDMAFFSLGSALREADRHQEAADAFRQALEHNPGMSRAYQHLGDALIKLDQTEEAAAVLTQGYIAAAERGDMMPQRAIEAMLTALKLPLPQAESADEQRAKIAAESGGQMVLDKRAGVPQPRLESPPMRGPLGQYIHEHFGQITWTQWIGQGTKVINELRLDFSNPEHQDVYEQHMLEWLGITAEDLEAFKPQASNA